MDVSVVPLAVYNPDGTPAALLLCSEKSRAKSIERGELWYVTPAGRVLPAWGGGVRTGDCDPVERNGSLWYETHLAADLPAGAVALAASRREDEPGGDTASGPEAASGTGRAADEIARLEAVIRQRRVDMPEGSYTTHLFTNGRDKIRKKLGEEAVEVLLAQSDDEVTSEAADLIYHLLVLLVERDLSVDLVLDELAARH